MKLTICATEYEFNELAVVPVSAEKDAVVLIFSEGSYMKWMICHDWLELCCEGAKKFISLFVVGCDEIKGWIWICWLRSKSEHHRKQIQAESRESWRRDDAD